ncbi:thioredoxin family protein [Salinimicrobium catena]|uniref:thioredoxin family protein n=1 Tax=Salinimicrobium catena TaxID=390640 RepID=UPI002FE44081
MKIFLYTLAVLTAVNCGSSNQNNKETEETTAIPAPPVQEEQNDILVGSIQKSDLTQAPHDAWFDPNYSTYEPSPEALETIKNNINDYEIKLFMGTWCSDSQLQVPRFLKLLEESDYDMDRLEMKAVEEDKTLPNDLHKEYDITYVPTIIFYIDGKEVNRFVEYPQKSFEEDIAAIVSGEDYKHSYE